MANTDNSCAKLEIKDLWNNATHTAKFNPETGSIRYDTLGDILNLQAETQKNVYGYDFENMTLRQVMDFWAMNTHTMVS